MLGLEPRSLHTLSLSFPLRQELVRVMIISCLILNTDNILKT